MNITLDSLLDRLLTFILFSSFSEFYLVLWLEQTPLSPHFAWFSLLVCMLGKSALSPSLEGVAMQETPHGAQKCSPAWPSDAGVSGYLLGGCLPSCGVRAELLPCRTSGWQCSWEWLWGLAARCCRRAFIWLAFRPGGGTRGTGLLVGHAHWC